MVREEGERKREREKPWQSMLMYLVPLFAILLLALEMSIAVLAHLSSKKKHEVILPRMAGVQYPG